MKTEVFVLHLIRASVCTRIRDTRVNILFVIKDFLSLGQMVCGVITMTFTSQTRIPPNGVSTHLVSTKIGANLQMDLIVFRVVEVL